MFNRVEASYVGPVLATQVGIPLPRVGVSLPTLRGIRLITNPANPPAEQRGEFR